MIQSMTGFGAAERDGFRVEVRSLNHRFSEMSVKLPPALGRHEMAMRDAIKERFRRGKFDVFVSAAGAGSVSVKLNREIAEGVLLSLRELKEWLSVTGEITLETLLGWKEFFLHEEVSFDPAPLFAAFGEALKGLEEMRLREGRALAEEIRERVEALEALNGQIMALCPAVAEAHREKFHQRLNTLVREAPVEEARVLQEAAAVAEKADISEEVHRVKTHLEHIRRVLADGDAVGRKLDFLLQELHREANTIASKAGDERVIHLVIEMKTEIERAREQAQNIQ